jgi:hypothetical protein
MPGKEHTPYQEAVELSSLKSPALEGGEFAFDPDVADLNDPDVESLLEPPLIGVRPQPSDMFGDEAENFGRATSPKLYAQASQFPTAVQFRVWRWENGVPVALGAIDAEATEEDFVRQFFDAMPRRGEGKFQYRLRPIDIRGKELGKEFTINISEHHSTLKRIRERKEIEREERMNGYGYGGRPGGDVHVHSGGEGEAGHTYAEEMGRMFESAVDSAEQRTHLLQQTLEQERERLRAEEKIRAEERVSTAERSANVVQTMTEKLMHSDRLRSDEAMKSQKEHGSVLMNTMTTVFQQQQEAQRQQAERMRTEDTRRQGQDREFYERQRQETESRRAQEREDWERKREEDRQRAKAEQESREAQRKYELEQLRIEADRRKSEDVARMERERERIREERDRNKQELEEKRLSEARGWEKRREEDQRRRDIERQDWERREALRREEMGREQEKRREEMLLQTKSMEMSAQRDREHSERMMEMARLERETQREAQSSREKMEREAREIQDRERQRAHEMAVREMEMAKERDREHQERMMKLSSSGMGGLKDMLGMETPELLSRIFGADGEDGGGWADAIPKMLGSLAEMGKVALTAQAEAAQEGTQAQIAAPTEKQVAIQTPQGVKMVPVSVLQQAQREMAAQRSNPMPPLPDFPMRPPGETGPVILDAEAVPVEEEEETLTDYAAALQVNALKRAKEAGISLGDQKKARKGARKLVERLAETSESEWKEIATGLIMETSEIYTYAQAVTVYVALAEAQAGEDLADRVVAELQKSGLMPKDVPYTEKDYAEMHKEKTDEV